MIEGLFFNGVQGQAADCAIIHGVEAAADVFAHQAAAAAARRNYAILGTKKAVNFVGLAFLPVQSLFHLRKTF